MSSFEKSNLRIDEYITLIEKSLHGEKVIYIGGEFDFMGVEFLIDYIERGMVYLHKDSIKDQPDAIVPIGDVEFI